jgi:hypothetical protein
MRDLSFEVGWQIDDIDGAKRTFLWADTATDAESFRDEGDLRLGCDLYAQFSCLDDWAGFSAFLSTFLLDSIRN